MQTTSNRTTSTLAQALLAASLCGPIASVNADDTFKMQIHPRETSGTWALEHEKHREAVAYLEIERARSRPGSRSWSAVLTNLCVGYIRLGDIESARTYCEQAVEDETESGVAYVNRGVMFALDGDYASAAADFEAARQFDGSTEFADHNIQRLGELVTNYRGDDPARGRADAIS